MNDDTIQDLKQFIAATVTQQTSEVIERLDSVDQRLDSVDQRLGTVEQKLDDVAASVADALENSNEATDAQIQDHQTRIVRLEQKTGLVA